MRRGALRQRVPVQVLGAPRHRAPGSSRRRWTRRRRAAGSRVLIELQHADLGRAQRRAGSGARSRCWSRARRAAIRRSSTARRPQFKAVVFADDGTPAGTLRRARDRGSTPVTLFGEAVRPPRPRHRRRWSRSASGAPGPRPRVHLLPRQQPRAHHAGPLAQRRGHDPAAARGASPACSARSRRAAAPAARSPAARHAAAHHDHVGVEQVDAPPRSARPAGRRSARSGARRHGSPRGRRRTRRSASVADSPAARRARQAAARHVGLDAAVHLAVAGERAAAERQVPEFAGAAPARRAARGRSSRSRSRRRCRA